MVVERKFKILICLIFYTSALLSQWKLAFIPFNDVSGFKGKWDLKVEIPRYIGDFVMKFYGVEVLPLDSVFKVRKEINTEFKDALLFLELNRRYGVENVVSGKILNFKVSRFMAGFPLIAGYESYSAVVEIECEIYDARTGERAVLFGAFGEVKDRGLGISLLGKPTERQSEFYSLDYLKFGSTEFNQTVIGEAMNKAGVDFAMRLRKYLPEIVKFSTSNMVGETELKANDVVGMILLVRDDGSIYINLGERDGIVKGMIGRIFDGEEEIGQLEVSEIIDAHFSACKIIQFKRQVKKGDKVVVRVVK